MKGVRPAPEWVRLVRRGRLFLGDSGCQVIAVKRGVKRDTWAPSDIAREERIGACGCWGIGRPGGVSQTIVKRARLVGEFI